MGYWLPYYNYTVFECMCSLTYQEKNPTFHEYLWNDEKLYRLFELLVFDIHILSFSNCFNITLIQNMITVGDILMYVLQDMYKSNFIAHLKNLKHRCFITACTCWIIAKAFFLLLFSFFRFSFIFFSFLFSLQT